MGSLMVPSSFEKVPRLQAGELEILEMLWRQGALSLSEAHTALGQPIGYTTVQTRLNRLVKKGLVERSAERPARYQAVITRDQVGRQDIETLLEHVSEGSVVPLVAHLVRDRRLTPTELAELKQLIAQAEEQAQSPGKRGRADAE